MTVPAPPPRLVLLHDAEQRTLAGVEVGRSLADQPAACLVRACDGVVHLLDRPGGRVVGFGVRRLDTLDAGTSGPAALWAGPVFDVPSLALTGATVGQVALAARRRFGDEDSLVVRLFDRAVRACGPEALAAWRDCLDAGDGRAHLPLGYTLLDLGRPHEAYTHLRRAVAVGPDGPWAWSWLGQAAEAVGEIDEARDAYRRACRTAAGRHGRAGDVARRALVRLGPVRCNAAPTPSAGPSTVDPPPTD